MADRSPRPYRCAECGVRYTESGAARAMRRGCRAGCSGLDVAEDQPKRGRGQPPLGGSGTVALEVYLTVEQRARVDSIAEREGLRGAGAAVRWLIDRDPEVS